MGELRHTQTQKTHMIGLWPPAPDHETDFAAPLRPLNAEEQPDPMNAVHPCAAGFEVGA